MTQGWFCPHCQRGLRPVEVTYEETCTTCGTCVTDVEPPAALAEIEGLVKETRTLLAENRGRAIPALLSVADRLATALETLSARVVEAEAKLARHEAHEYEEAMYAAEAAWKEEKARVAQLEAALREIRRLSAGVGGRGAIFTIADEALPTEAKAQGGEHE